MKTQELLRGTLAGLLAIMGVLAMTGCTIDAPPPGVDETSIVITIPEDPPSFNGLVTDAGFDSLVMELVMLSVTDIDPQGNIFPELAAGLPTLENGGVVIDEATGAMDVTWTLRDDVRWADGEPLTAEDVLFTWQAISDPEGGIWLQGSDYIDRIEQVDDTTFVVHYTSVFPGYLTQFGGDQVVIWPAHYCDASQGFVAWDCNRQPLSSGPYQLEEWVTGDHLSFVRNPEYTGPVLPSIERILVRVVPEPAVRRTMLTRGDSDLDVWVTESGLEELSDEPGLAVSLAPTSRWVFRLFPNLVGRGTTDPAGTPHPVFSDVRVRQAMRMAVDVDTINQKVFFGYGKPVWTEFFRPPYDVCDIPRPAYDPAGAAALLEQAGWIDTDGDGVRECHGCGTAEEGAPMAFELATYGEYGPELEQAHQLIGEMLGALGMQPSLRIIQGTVMWADAASGGTEQNGEFDLDLYDDGYPGVDPTDHLYFYYHSYSAEPDNGFNVGRWVNPEFDALLDQAYTLDEAVRQELFCQMAGILDAELPQILLFSAVNSEVHTDRLQGIQSTANDMVTWNVAEWTLAD
jgi:peptide/nickel transport system substrate-binding protein